MNPNAYLGGLKRWYLYKRADERFAMTDQVAL
jgi:hypothetical protein